MAYMCDIGGQTISLGTAYYVDTGYHVKYGVVPKSYNFRQLAVNHWNEVDYENPTITIPLYSCEVSYIDYAQQTITKTVNFEVRMSYDTNTSRTLSVNIVDPETHDDISGTAFTVYLAPLPGQISPYEQMALVKLNDALDPFFEGKYAWVSMPYNIDTQQPESYDAVVTASKYDPFGIFALGAVNVDTMDLYIEDTPAFTPNGSGTGGGAGTGIPDSDTITPDGTPTQGFMSSGMGRLYNPEYTDMGDLAQFMLSADFTQNVSKLLNDPMDYLISLHALPFSPPTGARQTVKLGGVFASLSGVNISAPIITSDYATINCGTIKVPETWGAFLDYSPYTKTSLYVPFVGMCELNPDEVIDAEINLQYRVYIATGDFVACLTSNTRVGTGITYHWQGNMALPIPLNARDYSSRITATISAGIGIATGLATGGVATSVKEGISGALNVANSKRSAVRSGGIGGAGSLLDNYTPYVVLSVPAQALPTQYGKLHGYTSFISTKLEKCKGYTVVEDIRLEGISCTENERDTLLRILKEGVYL